MSGVSVGESREESSSRWTFFGFFAKLFISIFASPPPLSSIPSSINSLDCPTHYIRPHGNFTRSYLFSLSLNLLLSLH